MNDLNEFSLTDRRTVNITWKNDLNEFWRSKRRRSRNESDFYTFETPPRPTRVAAPVRTRLSKSLHLPSSFGPSLSC